ncbi:MAG: hypothetical protein JKX88_06255 [Marinicaulis sp.]|nr:hypothetical protein [Marinicaulis sp.]
MSGSKLKLALFILRFGIAFFFAIWALEKFIKPETTVAIWKAFYYVDALPLQASYLIGAIQMAAVLLFFFGILKFWTYGLLMVMHLGSTILSFDRIMDPYTGSNHLFVAAVPVLGALVALFILREEDTLFTFSGKGRSKLADN